MVLSERFVDSYPYEMSQMPYYDHNHPYQSCFGSGPQMKVKRPRSRHGYPSQYHRGDGYYAGPGSRAAYPQCTQSSIPFDHPGRYYRSMPHEPKEYGNGKSKSSGASDRNRFHDGKVNTQSFARPAEHIIKPHPSKKVRTIEVKDVSKADQNNETRKVQEVLDVKSKKTCSDIEIAPILIQSVYRGYNVRRFNLLDKLKKIVNIREHAAGVEGQIQSLLTLPPPVDEKLRIELEESIMSLLLKLDGVQGLPPQFREIRKSAVRELTRMQERLDSLTMQNFEGVKDEDLSEPLEHCVDSNNEELKEGGANEADNQQMHVVEDESETPIPDQTTVSSCSIMEKENIVEDLTDDEVADWEKIVKDVELEVGPEVNLNVELEVNPSHEAARGCEVEQAELCLSPNDGSEVETSTTAAPEHDVRVEAEVEWGGSEEAGAASSPAPVLPGTQKESDVGPETQDEGEVSDGPLSSPSAAVVQDEAVGGAIFGSYDKLVKENEELHKLAEKLMQVTKEQSDVISELNERIGILEKSLPAHQKLARNTRDKRRENTECSLTEDDWVNIEV